MKNWETSRFNSVIQKIHFVFCHSMIFFPKELGKVKTLWQGLLFICGEKKTKEVFYLLKKFNAKNIFAVLNSLRLDFVTGLFKHFRTTRSRIVTSLITRRFGSTTLHFSIRFGIRR